MYTNKYRQERYDAYDDECRQVEIDYDNGDISAEQRVQYLKNLANILEMDLEPDCEE